MKDSFLAMSYHIVNRNMVLQKKRKGVSNRLIFPNAVSTLAAKVLPYRVDSSAVLAAASSYCLVVSVIRRLCANITHNTSDANCAKRTLQTEEASSMSTRFSSPCSHEAGLLTQITSLPFRYRAPDVLFQGSGLFIQSAVGCRF